MCTYIKSNIILLFFFAATECYLYMYSILFNIIVVDVIFFEVSVSLSRYLSAVLLNRVESRLVDVSCVEPLVTTLRRASKNNFLNCDGRELGR